MATQTGLTGSATYATVDIPNLRNITFGARRGAIDTTVKGNKITQVKPGLVVHTVSFEALLDYVTGQQDLIDFLESATPDATGGTLVLTLDTGKTVTYTTGAVLLSLQVVSPPGDNPVTVAFEFQCTVAGIVAWA